MDDLGFEDTQRPLLDLAKQMANLEEMERSKFDACVDWFWAQLLESIEIEENEGSHLPLRFESLQFPSDEEMYRIKPQLLNNLNRLLPNVFEGDIVESEGFAELMETRLPFVYRATKLNTLQEYYIDPSANAYYSQLIDPIFTHFCKGLDGDNTTESLVISERLVQNTACDKLAKTIAGNAESASFVCGSLITIQSNEASKNDQVPSSPPVRLGWCIGEGHPAHLLTLPLCHNLRSESAIEGLSSLAQDCVPASFGKGGEDVLDLEYRKAGKLDPHQFTSSFNLSDFQILENVEQMLLPNLFPGDNSQRIKAELYKLNVYSGPCGLFRKHVDTPRSTAQIGSLVVCLPSHFTGGNLIVRHQGKEVDLDWSQHSENTIQWAAFYSDCEHEIKTITAGQRITLTYNLYVTRPTAVGLSVPTEIVIDPKSLSSYACLKHALMNPEFFRMGKFTLPKDWLFGFPLGDYVDPVLGGILGIHCSHAYPHTSEGFSDLLPNALKGADLELFSIFKRLGIYVVVRPVFDSETKELKRAYNDKLDQLQEDDYQEFLSSLPVGPSNIDLYWKFLLFSRRMRTLEDVDEYAKKNNIQLHNRHLSERFLIGRKLTPFRHSDGDEQDDTLIEILMGGHRWDTLRGVTWMGCPGNQEKDFTYLAYGNEASVGTFYSCAAIIAHIPPFHIREQLFAARDW
ncbi:Oxoglutarate/iron-dependent dioxygenase [Penicillium brevicompactum]|uniref:Oxoglutarate/iron-dependent dioxygenase n=1 Tax=Penicillium brevicompactum TaxID=5074 RepID=UPI00253FF8C3|nr:Oxoglutarate/iron-dependent dioxygenase [Penicillium brevicompactum]KAJ5322019.1 Oxoglutarate/iron-dependent dioxygenase [Penicillium brevicompactum]